MEDRPDATASPRDLIAQGWIAVYAVPASMRIGNGVLGYGLAGLGGLIAVAFLLAALVTGHWALLVAAGIGLFLAAIGAVVTATGTDNPPFVMTDGTRLGWATDDGMGEATKADIDFIERGPVRGHATINFSSGDVIHVPIQPGWPQFVAALDPLPVQLRGRVAEPTLLRDGFLPSASGNQLRWQREWASPVD